MSMFVATDYVSKDELLKWTCDMVSIPSYSGLPRQEEAVGRYIYDLLVKEGLEARVEDLGQGRCNVLARLKGSSKGRSLMLNGHMDTVPYYDMENAAVPTLKDGYLYGRGTSDMKGAIAAMLGAIIALKRSGQTLAGDLILAAVADEEEGSLGTISLLQSGVRADAVIVGEAMGRRSIAIAQKGLEWFEFTVHGRTVHGGAQDKGVNAILMATRLIDALNSRLGPALKQRKHELLGNPTFNIGVINGGTQLSTVPSLCKVQMDRRFLPDTETYESMYSELTTIIDELSAEDPNFSCELNVLESSVMKKGYVHQGMEQRRDDPLVLSLKTAIEAVSGEPAQLIGCPCWTDAALFAHYGSMTAVVYGPGDLTKCHSKDECIDPETIYECCNVYANCATSFCNK